MGGARIIDRVAGSLQAATGTPPFLVANVPDAAGWLPGATVVSDVVPGVGSLGGILTAVEHAAPVVCVAWDMPFVPESLLRALVAGLAAADVVIPESDGRRGVEPLCAAYGPACGPAIRRALERGDRRAIAFHDEVRIERIPLARVLQYGDPRVVFLNVNSPDDLKHAESTWRARGSYP